MQLEKLRTTREVSKMLGCTQRNISKLVEAKKLKPVKILENGLFLFDAQDVDSFFKQKKSSK
jgi:excisionase family DNA binding protein